jgi:hypothetical protein
MIIKIIICLFRHITDKNRHNTTSCQEDPTMPSVMTTFQLHAWLFLGHGANQKLHVWPTGYSFWIFCITVDIFWNESKDQKHCVQELPCGQDPYAINVDDSIPNHFFPHLNAGCRKMCKRFSYVSCTMVGLMWKETIRHWESNESLTVHTVLTLVCTNPVATCLGACQHVIDLNLAQRMHIKSGVPRAVGRVWYESLSPTRKIWFWSYAQTDHFALIMWVARAIRMLNGLYAIYF